MTGDGRVVQSDYMRFAKLRGPAAFNLASSGVADCTLGDLGASLADLELHGPNAYGYRPLVERIAGRFGVDPACVVTAAGCSFANHLALATLVEPGDEVLVEDPTYELLVSTLGYLRATIRRFERRPEHAWRLDPQEVAGRLTSRTRLVVVTNLHNPTGAVADEAAIDAVAQAAATVGASVLVDEVYLELTFPPGQARTAFREGGNVVVTSSLTKAYGLSGLRCGWILAPAELAERMWRLNDLYAATAPHIAERLSLLAFDNLEALRARAQAILAANRAAYGRILGAHTGLEPVDCGAGTTVFPRLTGMSADALFDRLSTKFDTSLVPGRFFGRPDRVRIGLGGHPGPTRAGLEAIAAAVGA